jgi:hypothetical protein
VTVRLSIVAHADTSFHTTDDLDLGVVEEGQHDNPAEWVELCLLDPQDPQPEYRTASAVLRLTTDGATRLRDQLTTLLNERNMQ